MANIHLLEVSGSLESAVPANGRDRLAAQDEEIALLRAEIKRLHALLSNREWLTSRVIKLLNHEKRLGFAFAIGTLATLLMTGTGLGVRAFYEAARHSPANAPVLKRRAPVSSGVTYVEDQGRPDPSPSASLSPTPPPAVAAVQPQPSPAASRLVPSPLPTLRVEHCRPPPLVRTPVPIPRFPHESRSCQFATAPGTRPPD